ncbi:hypothetical protein MMYC01_206641 [Madurella mycetomatis]|uniref:Uncharacterized protein n=1 Tax=Madurella mycetomatis TaxID=100816 RepID=A0A175VZX4_9PEZI|nr:hypothetical protein MMYC01_206641 [Madurella mycetomatis]
MRPPSEISDPLLSDTTAHEDDEYLEALAEADKIVQGYTFASTEIYPEEEDDGLAETSEHLASLASTLFKRLAQTSSQAWERDLQFDDLAEEVARLKDQLRDSVALCDLANPPKRPRSALKIAFKKAAQARQGGLENLQKQNKKLEAELEALRAELEPLRAEMLRLKDELAQQRSENLMLKYQAMDMGQEVWRLDVWLRNSIALCDLASPPPKPKTVLERALEEKISKLEARIRNPTGRSRSKSLNI